MVCTHCINSLPCKLWQFLLVPFLLAIFKIDLLTKCTQLDIYVNIYNVV